MLTGLLGAPAGWLVNGSVAWNVNGVGRPVSWVIPQVRPSAPLIAPSAAARSALGGFTLRMLANAVATVPTSTERLVGKTAATSGGGGRHSESRRVANEKNPAELAT